MAVRKAARRSTPRRIPWAIVGAVAAVIAVAVVGSLFVRGCRQGGDPRFAKWGGMSKEEWLKQNKERQEAEAKKEEENRKREAEAKKKKEEEARRAAEEKKMARVAAAASKQAEGTGIPQGESNTGVPEKTPDAKPELIASLPKDPTAWKDEDVLAARLGGDPRLVTALEYRAERFPREEPQAIFLRDLLAPKQPAPTKDPGEEPKKAAAPSRPLPLPVLAVVANTLVRNTTSAARQAIADLLAGAFGLENDQVAVQVTLKALADHPSEVNDRALLAALAESDKVRPAGKGQVTPEALRKLAFTVVEQNGKSSVRLQLAKLLLDPACPEELRSLALPLLEQNRPENLEAQVLLFQSARMDPIVEALLEKQLLVQSHRALNRVFKLEDRRGSLGGDSAVSGPEAEPEWLSHVARLLWSDGVATVLETRQMAMRSLEQSANTVLFASTIPTREARARLARTVARRWEEDPKALTAAGWTTTLLSEPGIMAVLRSVRGSRPPADRGDRKAASHVRESSSKQEDGWLAAERALAREYCRRLFAAGLAQARARGVATGEDGPEGAGPPLAIPLHPQASVVAWYRVRWPEAQGAPEAETRKDSTEVSFVRIEETGFPRAVLAHYQRAFQQRTGAAGRAHPLADGVWLETLLPADDKGRCRSIDVFLTRANPKSETPPEKRQEITVEVLVVDLSAFQAGPRMKAQARAEPGPDGLP